MSTKTSGTLSTLSFPSAQPGRVLPREPAASGAPLKLSILMPAFNEERTIARAVAEVLACEYPWPFELIIVDDGSKDRTREIIESFEDPRLVVLRHPRNLGKGAAIQSAAAVSTGTHLVPFDADLEYAPGDLIALMAPIASGRAEVVFGPRMFGVNTRYQSYRHAMGNRALTFAANVLFDSYLSDMHTCLKVLPVALFAEMDLSENGFGLDTEITARLLKLGIRPFEVPVSYYSRSIAQGKKITWRDGVECLQVMARVRWASVRSSATLRGNLSAAVRPIRDPAPEDDLAEEHAARLVS
jgi:dolichol-phosphate hexosyltransferase